MAIPKNRTVKSPASRHDTPTSETSSSSNLASTSPVEIDATGDLVLHIQHESATSKSTCSFRVNASSLRTASKYFQNLLTPGRFGEGAAIEAQHAVLREQYTNFAQVPATELPVVRIEEIGRISAIKAVDALLTDFLLILHGKTIQSSPPVANLANLAIVADRFDALETVSGYMQRKKVIRAIDGKTTSAQEDALNEEKIRQRLLVGLLFEYSLWVDVYSSRLMLRSWEGKDVEPTTALWWDLPSRVEDEIAYRRECILDTLQSVPAYFLQLYTSRDRQCRLGYDSSAQCDSFQLGEMIRFFKRHGILELQSTLVESSDPAGPFTGNIPRLINTLRQVPEYQIDKFHAHCGLRTQLIPMLDFLGEAVRHIGICLECWKGDRQQHAWIHAHRPLMWKGEPLRLRIDDHRARHAQLSGLFTAHDREWSLWQGWA